MLLDDLAKKASFASRLITQVIILLKLLEVVEFDAEIKEQKNRIQAVVSWRSKAWIWSRITSAIIGSVPMALA